jgi:hypothetical protein
LSLPGHDQLLRAIVERICAIVGRLPRDRAALADVLGISEDDLRRLDEPQRQPNATVVVDLVAALVREFAVDPQWLLSGQYDATVHRKALALGEDPSNDGTRAIQQLVREQYRKLLEGPHYLTLPHPSTDSE